MVVDGFEYGYIEFLERVVVVTFIEVKRVVVDGMREVELFVYFVY